MELWDLYDANRRLLGRDHIRGQEIPPGCYHLVVHVWIRNSRGEYLISQRSVSRPTSPLKWECVGGSVLKGEDSLIGALRETKEEVGLTLSPDDGKLVYSVVGRVVNGVKFMDILDVWLFRYDSPLDLRNATTDEVAQIQATYQLFNEDSRLNHSKAARVEFITTTRYIEKYLKPGMKILDVGAGAGEYSLYFARSGFEVSALELTDSNIAAFRKKLLPEDNIDLVQGNALDLSRYADDSFDIVLVFGPLYHLHSEDDRLRCIAEAKRVCKKDGKLFFAFIFNDIVILTMFAEHPDYFVNGDYNKETFDLLDFPFVFHTVQECRELLSRGGVKLLHQVASDGVSELLAGKINDMDEESYAQYLRYHAYICEKPEFLGMSNHLLFVGEK